MKGASHRTVITGVGVVTAAGIGIEQTWLNVQSNCPIATAVTVPGPAETTTQFLAYITPEYSIGDVVKTVLPSAQLEREGINSSRDLKHLIAAVGLALQDANLHKADVDFDVVGLVVADEHPGIEQLSRKLFNGVSAGDVASFENPIFELNSFLVPYRIARAFGLGGECVFVNSACTSGLNAIDYAAAQIRIGRTPVAIAAGSDDPLSMGKFQWFARQELYAVAGQLLPFSKEAKGTVFGDGGAALVLEDRDHAIARGAPIYAEYLGAGFTQDGWRISAPHPQRANLARAIRRALDDAGVASDQVDIVVPHGTGIKTTDQYERRCLSEVWPNSDHAPICMPLKPFFGHNLGGASILEAAILAKSVEAQQVPPVAPLDQPRQGLLLTGPGDWDQKNISIAVKASTAFAGFCGAIVLGRDQPS